MDRKYPKPSTSTLSVDSLSSSCVASIQVLEEVNSNRKALMMLDASLLERLTSNTGNLLEDEELIGVLANTKAKVRGP